MTIIYAILESFREAEIVKFADGRDKRIKAFNAALFVMYAGVEFALFYTLGFWQVAVSFAMTGFWTRWVLIDLRTALALTGKPFYVGNTAFFDRLQRKIAGTWMQPEKLNIALKAIYFILMISVIAGLFGNRS